MAFDIATSTGAAFGSVGSIPHCTTINMGDERGQEYRFAKAYWASSELITKYKPDLVVFESPIGGPMTSHFLVGLAACVIAGIYSSGVTAKQVQIASVRKHFLGRHFTTRDFPGMSKSKAKQAIKQQVINRCEMLKIPVRNDDEADAAACWDYACATYCNAQSAPHGGLFNG